MENAETVQQLNQIIYAITALNSENTEDYLFDRYLTSIEKHCALLKESRRETWANKTLDQKKIVFEHLFKLGEPIANSNILVEKSLGKTSLNEDILSDLLTVGKEYFLLWQVCSNDLALDKIGIISKDNDCVVYKRLYVYPAWAGFRKIGVDGELTLSRHGGTLYEDNDQF
jgi:hypothetical protein